MLVLKTEIRHNFILACNFNYVFHYVLCNFMDLLILLLLFELSQCPLYYNVYTIELFIFFTSILYYNFNELRYYKLLFLLLRLLLSCTYSCHVINSIAECVSALLDGVLFQYIFNILFYNYFFLRVLDLKTNKQYYEYSETLYININNTIYNTIYTINYKLPSRIYRSPRHGSPIGLYLHAGLLSAAFYFKIEQKW